MSPYSASKFNLIPARQSLRGSLHLKSAGRGPRGRGATAHGNAVAPAADGAHRR